MFKFLFSLAAVYFITVSSLCYSGCDQSVEVGIGWRKDNTIWKLKDLHDCYISAEVDSHIRFKDIEYYTAYTKARWAGERFYIRLSADYGLSEKGRAKELFGINSSYLCHDHVEVATNDPIKKRSEVYDFNGAVGYPLSICDCRLCVVPLIGFSFHRQRTRVKAPEHCSCCCYSSDYGYYRPSCSSTYFYPATCSCPYPFGYSQSSNPFGSPSSSDYRIASELNLSTSKRTSNYRFTWYGFYLGADIAYALDGCWTIYTELEGHFLDRCHRKRRSWTGVYFIDDYHNKDWGYGFTTNTGTTFSMSACWYATLSVDYRWWKSYSSHDKLSWKSTGINAALGYSF
jgi:hypothetical protein